MKKFFKEFRDFVARGNVVDLAVAVVIGSAFSAIVTALTNKIIMPLINALLSVFGGKEGLESAYTILVAGYTDGELDLAKSIYIDWGAFVAATFNFVIVAFVLFLIVKFFNASKRKIEALNVGLKTWAKKEVVKQKLAIRKQAKENGVPFKKAWKEFEEKKQLELEQKQKQIAEEEAKKKDEEYRLAHKQELLLEEIRDILKNRSNN